MRSIYNALMCRTCYGQHNIYVESSAVPLTASLAFLMGFFVGFAPNFGFGGIGLAPLFAFAIVILKLGTRGNLYITRKHLFPIIGFSMATLLIVSGLGISSIFSESYEDVRIFVIGGQYLISLLFFIVLLSMLDHPSIVTAIKGYLYGGIALVFVSIVVFLFFHDIGRSMGWIRSTNRIHMWMGPNGFANHLTLVAMFVLYWYGILQKKYYLAVPLVMFFFVLILMSGSNGGLLLFVFGAVLMSFIVDRRMFLVVGGGIIAFSILIFFNIELLVQEYGLRVLHRFMWTQDFNHTNIGSLSSRVETFEHAWQYIIVSPILGAGAGAAHAFGILHTGVGGSQQVHNTFLLLWLEGGILSLLGVLLIFCFMTGVAIKFKGSMRLFILLNIALLFLSLMMNSHFYAVWRLMPLYLIICFCYTRSGSYSRL